ncbi:MAG: AmmeMemoRadiSam system protein B [Armatimonadota bacterium]|nr:AmmeMemoRadiSam system protein B [Armatimonadota bacterium]MDR5702083.1 AmmeMemoRadiSam system protein B [Armatimonadota bacterium]
MALPRLRRFDAYPVRLNGRDFICLRDLEGVLDEPVLLSPQAFLVATLLDGQRDVLDIQAEYARRSGGDLLLSWDLQRIVEELDRYGLLETQTFTERRKQLEESFRNAPVRSPYHAGKAYPSDPDVLRTQLSGYFATVDPRELNGLKPRGIIVPHIDFARGGWCYAWGYAALHPYQRRTYIVLGVAHSGPPVPFVLTRKPFQTPLGVMEVDQNLADALQREAGDLTEYEAIHRTEHSVEFQVLFLQHMAGSRPIRILPLLCANLEEWAKEGSPRDVEAIERVIQVLRDLVLQARGEIGVIASVDFSHVGPRFGDVEPVGPALASRTSLDDRAALEAIVRGDAEEFWRTITRRGNPNRIDALSAVYVALRLLEPVQGKLLRYGQAQDPAGGLVSFASLALL